MAFMLYGVSPLDAVTWTLAVAAHVGGGIARDAHPGATRHSSRSAHRDSRRVALTWHIRPMDSSPIGRLFQSPAVRAAVGLVLGLIVGIAIVSSGSASARAAAETLEPIGTMWVNAIRMTIVPLVVSLLIAALGAESRSNVAGRLGVRAIVLFVVMLGGVAVLGILLGPMVMGGLHIDPASAASLRASAASSTAQPTLPGFSSWLVALVPANPIKAAADGAMLPMIVFAVVFGVALSRLAPAVRVPTAALFRGFADAMLILVKWVLALAPIGVFVLAMGLALHLGTNLAGAVVFFLVAHCAVLVGIGALLYVAARVGGGVSLGPVRSRDAARADRGAEHPFVRRRHFRR